jgi:hypothetical protein
VSLIATIVDRYPPLYLSADASPSGRLVRFLRAAHEPEEEAMVKVYVSPSMSLDGFITGPNPRPGEPMGDGGERLHEWMAGMADFRERGDTSNADADVLRELSSRTGALLMGRTMFDAGEVPWGDDPRSACRSSSSPTALERR